MSRADRTYWDQRWTEIGPAPVTTLSPDPPHFADLLEFFPIGLVTAAVAGFAGFQAVGLRRMETTT